MGPGSASIGFVTIPSPWQETHQQCRRVSPARASDGLLHSAEIRHTRQLKRSPTDLGHLELSSIRTDSRRYSRRQLSFEEVRCIHVEESLASNNDSNDDVYTFRIKPVLLYAGQQAGRIRKGIGYATLGSGSGEAVRRQDAARGDTCQQDVEAYEMQRTAKEIVHLSHHLLSTFETLLDPKRGGPQPLDKERLQSKRPAKGLFKRKKKLIAGEADTVVVGMSKIDLVNDFFATTLRVGGEVVSSSRAMQDFFDKGNVPAPCEEQRCWPISSPLIQAMPVLNELAISPNSASDDTIERETPMSTPPWQSRPCPTPLSASSERKLRLWKRLSPESGHFPAKARPAISLHITPFTMPSALTDEEFAPGAVLAQADSETTMPRTPKKMWQAMPRSISSQNIKHALHWKDATASRSAERDPDERLSEESTQHLIGFDTPLTSTSDGDSAQLELVRRKSAGVVKSKASPWKFVKGSPIPSQKAWKGQQDRSTPSPTLSHSLGHNICGARSGAQTSLPPDIKGQIDREPYVPSELERLIFGNGSKSAGPLSTSAESDPFADVCLCCEVEQLRDEEEKETTVLGDDEELRARSRSDTILPSYHTMHEKRASYKNKGRALHLRLDLAGRSNINTASMLASAKDSTLQAIQSPLFDAIGKSKRGNYEQGEGPDSREFSSGSDLFASPLLTPISKQLAAIQVEAESMSRLHLNEQQIRNGEHATDGEASKLFRRLSVEECCSERQATESERAAIEREVQLWKSKRRRPQGSGKPKV